MMQKHIGGENGQLDATDIALRVENLTVRYGTENAIHDVSLDVAKNRVTALIGPSGCGKTSFLLALNRLTDLIPGCAVTGQIHYDGRDVRSAAENVQNLRRNVGMIFQKPNPFPLTIRRNIEMPLKEHGVRNRSDLDNRTEQALIDVGLWSEVKERLDTPALALSGGQQQRLCIARALVLRPSVLLMDEPCSALDPLSSAVVEDLIVQLKKSYSVVVVTHNLGQARRVSDRCAFFWHVDGAGRLIEEGPTANLFANARDALTASYISGARG